jgi:hypothetical protein
MMTRIGDVVKPLRLLGPKSCAIMSQPMENLDVLISAGVIPQNHTLSADDIEAVNELSHAEVDTLIAVKFRLGDDFLQRNVKVAPNCFL